MSWRVAKSLLHLRKQINDSVGYHDAEKKRPKRATGSDGTIGDSAHSSRSSDHNAWVRDRMDGAVVTAMDITHDPRSGVDANAIANALLASRDKRIKYLISNGKIASATVAPKWSWRPYSGSNPHRHHFHLSVQPAQTLFDDESDWTFDKLTPVPEAPEAEKKPVLRKGDHGEHVAYMQKALGIRVDGIFGGGTEHSVIEYQKLHGLVPDGVVGPLTWEALLKGETK